MSINVVKKIVFCIHTNAICLQNNDEMINIKNILRKDDYNNIHNNIIYKITYFINYVIINVNVLLYLIFNIYPKNYIR